MGGRRATECGFTWADCTREVPPGDQEPATGWNRPKFEEAVRDAIQLHKAGLIEVLLFPRVDRETRFLFASIPILSMAFRSGLEVYFARERFRLDTEDSESISRYFRIAEESRAYANTTRTNTPCRDENAAWSGTP